MGQLLHVLLGYSVPHNMNERFTLKNDPTSGHNTVLECLTDDSSGTEYSRFSDIPMNQQDL